MKKFKKIMILSLLALFVFAPLSVNAESARWVYSGVLWNEGGSYYTSVYSSIQNLNGKVDRVRAKVARDYTFKSGGEEKFWSYAQLDGWGRKFTYYQIW